MSLFYVTTNALECGIGLYHGELLENNKVVLQADKKEYELNVDCFTSLTAARNKLREMTDDEINRLECNISNLKNTLNRLKNSPFCSSNFIDCEDVNLT